MYVAMVGVFASSSLNAFNLNEFYHIKRAVLVFPPSLDFIIAFLACLKAGVVAVPVFPPHPTRRDTLVMFTKIVEACGAKIALTSASYSHMKKLACKYFIKNVWKGVVL